MIDDGLRTTEYQYNETVNLPKRHSYSQDFWGFYNGKSNSTLIPSMYYGSEYMSGADRTVSTSHTQANILTKVIYPTKGYSTFEYENNTYYDTSVNQNKYSGGLRIKKIDHYDGATHTYQHYNYNKLGTTQSSGLEQGTPIFSTISEQPTSATQSCKYVVRASSSSYPLTSDIGKYVGYTHVTERQNTATESRRTEYKFTNYGPDFYTGSYQTLLDHPTDYSWKKGKLVERKVYDNENTLVEKEVNSYDYDDHFVSSPENYGTDKLAAGLTVRMIKHDNASGSYISAEFEWNYFWVKSSWIKKIQTVNTMYYDSGEFETITNYFYDNTNHAQLTRVETTNSNNETMKVKNYYPDDVVSTSSLDHDALTSTEYNDIQKLRKTGSNQHRIGTVLQKETFRNNVLESTTRTLFKDWGSNIVLPKEVQTAKGSAALDDRITYHSYYSNGNVKEVSKKDGTRIVYIWGYNDNNAAFYLHKDKTENRAV